MRIRPIQPINAAVTHTKGNRNNHVLRFLGIINSDLILSTTRMLNRCCVEESTSDYSKFDIKQSTFLSRPMPVQRLTFIVVVRVDSHNGGNHHVAAKKL